MASRPVSQSPYSQNVQPTLNSRAFNGRRNTVINLVLLVVIFLVISLTNSLVDALSRIPPASDGGGAAVVNNVPAQPVVLPPDSPFASQILKNRSFETKGKTEKEAAQWTRFNADDDMRLCNKVNRPGIPDLIVANTGECAFRFMGEAGRTTLLTQNVKPVVGVAGDTLHLTGFVEARQLTWANNGTAQLRLMVDYQGGESETHIAGIFAGGYDYTEIAVPPLVLMKKVKKVRVQIRMVNGSGKFYVDTLSLLHVPKNEATAMPLPPP